MATYASARYVDQAGSGDNSGDDVSNFMPLATFNAGATAGDTALMYATAVFTTLIKPVASGTSGNPITYQAGVGESPVITVATGWPGNINIDQEWIVLDGIRSTASLNHGLHLAANNFVFKNGEIDNSTLRGFNILKAATRENITIETSDFHDNAWQGIIYYGDADNYVLQKVTIDTCNIYNNAKEGIRLGNETYNSTRLLHEIEVKDCVIYGNTLTQLMLRNQLTITWSTYWGYGLKVTGNTVYDGGDATQGNAIFITGFRHEEARPAYVMNNVSYNNFVGGSQIQSHSNFDVLFANNTAHTSKAWNGIDGVGMFCDQGTEDCKYRNNKIYNCTGVFGVSNSGTAIAIWTGRNNSFLFNEIADCKDAFGFGHADDSNNYIYHNSVYALNNTNNDSHGVTQFGTNSPVATAVRVHKNIFSGMDYGMLTTDNQTDVSHNCWHNYAIAKLSGQTTNDNEVDADPQFVNPTILPSTWNFNLKGTSPCIDAGTDSVALTTDAGTGTTITCDTPELFWADVSEGITMTLDVGANYDLTLEGHNPTTGALTFAETITWGIGDKIQFSNVRGKKGSNSDLGAYGFTGLSQRNNLSLSLSLGL